MRLAAHSRRVPGMVALAAAMHVCFLSLLASLSPSVWHVQVGVVLAGVALAEQWWMGGARSGSVHWTTPAMGLCWLLTTIFLFVDTSANAHVGIGFTLAGVGVLLRLSAVRALKSRYGAGVQPTGPIVRSGPYRFLHHPGELGQLLIAVGCALWIGSLAALLFATTIMMPIVLWRARLEDRALAVR